MRTIKSLFKHAFVFAFGFGLGLLALAALPPADRRDLGGLLDGNALHAATGAAAARAAAPAVATKYYLVAAVFRGKADAPGHVIAPDARGGMTQYIIPEASRGLFAAAREGDVVPLPRHYRQWDRTLDAQDAAHDGTMFSALAEYPHRWRAPAWGDELELRATYLFAE